MDHSDHLLAPGTRIDRYEIEAQLGMGGFGAVYRAKHTLLGHGVALKLLHPEHTGSEELLERFFREAKAAAAIGSRHIALVRDCGTSKEGWHFLAMELLHGRSLEEILGPNYPRTPLALDRSVTMSLQILESLSEAHAAGIIHRDLKPANIFLVREPGTSEELVKLLDFGVSKFRSNTEGPPLTQTGAMLGTPLYMAPEQFHNARDVDQRVDLYSAAAVLYESLSGHAPFEAQTYADLVVQICCEAVKPLSQIAPHVPDNLCAVVMRGLAREPERRWSTAEAFARAILEHHCGAGDDTIPGSDPDSTRPGLAAPVDVTARTAVSELASSPALPSAPLSEGSPKVASDLPHFPSIPGVAQEQAHQVIPETVPSAPAVVPSMATGSAKTGSSRRWIFIVVPLAILFGAGLIGGGVLAARHFLLERYQVVSVPSTPGPSPNPSLNPSPNPSLNPSPNPSLNPSPNPSPLPGSGENDPVGQLLTGVLGTVGEGLARQPPAPMEGDPALGVQLYHPQLMGQLDQAAIEQVLHAAQPGMVACRVPGQNVHVRLQVQINLNQVGSIGAAPSNQGMLPTVDCVAERFRQAIPQSWAPGQGGVFFFDVGLSPR